jgi:VWFA-related protein
MFDRVSRKQLKICCAALLAALLIGSAPLRSQQTGPISQPAPDAQTAPGASQSAAPAQPAPNSQPPATTQSPAGTQTPPASQSPAAAKPASGSQATSPAMPQAAPISVEVKVVTMLASVRDKHGKLIHGLNKDDFALEQDGHAQTIKYFAHETDLPLTLGLLVDTSGSQRRVLDQERTASRTFVDHVLREDRDKAFLIHFDHEVELLQDLTPSRQKLEAALDQVGAPQFSQTSSGGSNGGSGSGDPQGSSRGGGRGGRGGGRSGGGTLLYDAIYLASDELMKKQQGRKAVIVLSDGVDRGSKESLQEAIESAERADTLVYSILFADKDAYGNGGGFGGPRMGGGGMGRGGGGYPRRTEEPRPDGKKILEQISRETGGRFFEVTKKQTIEDIYAAIDEELRSQYSLGYTPEKADNGSGYHKIQLTTKQKDYVVQTREGFFVGQ